MVGSVAHSEKLEVLETRRRFVKVRTSTGIVGWTDSNQLLNSQQMDELHRLSDSAAKLPPQGSAKVFDPVNMHTEPNRQSPSFYQIPEAGTVEVLQHRATPRVQVVATPPVRRAAPVAKKAKGKEPKTAIVGPPPPPGPPPPRDWVELSRPRVSDLPGYAPPPGSTPPVLEDWNLVRTRDGKAGWVLARMLYMSIPDEVAQYAEGHRITAYLPLGDVKDGDQVKHNWLWTTVANGQHSCEFDSFRVFVWSTKRHRYETAYIERNVRGYYPVEITVIPGQESVGFSLVMDGKDEKPYTYTYAFSGYHVRMASKVPYDPPRAGEVREAQNRTGVDPAPEQNPVKAGWRERVHGWKKSLFGGK